MLGPTERCPPGRFDITGRGLRTCRQQPMSSRTGVRSLFTTTATFLRVPQTMQERPTSGQRRKIPQATKLSVVVVVAEGNAPSLGIGQHSVATLGTQRSAKWAPTCLAMESFLLRMSICSSTERIFLRASSSAIFLPSLLSRSSRSRSRCLSSSTWGEEEGGESYVITRQLGECVRGECVRGECVRGECMCCVSSECVRGVSV